jgi:hypothetical protein
MEKHYYAVSSVFPRSGSVLAMNILARVSSTKPSLTINHEPMVHLSYEIQLFTILIGEY